MATAERLLGAEAEDVYAWQTKPHEFVKGLALEKLSPHSLCGRCGLPSAHSIHLPACAESVPPAVAGGSSADRVVLSDRVLTCAACSRLFEVDDDGTLPQHNFSSSTRSEVLCPGSYTKGHPHRMLPEGRGFTFIEIVDEPNGNGEDRYIAGICDAARFLMDWATVQAMPRDTDSLARVIAHANNAQRAALFLMPSSKGIRRTLDLNSDERAGRIRKAG